MNCPPIAPCGCQHLGCFDRCEIVELPMLSQDMEPVLMLISVGGAVVVQTLDYYAPGEPLFVNLNRIGQVGTIRVFVQERCFELDVKTIKTL